MFEHLYPYQEKMLDNCWGSASPKVVMAACCNSGKTIMSIAFILAWLRENEGNVLVLTHGTKVIKSNFLNEVETYFSLFPNKKDKEMFNARVKIILPQSFEKVKGEFGLVIVDEGHHYYLAAMVNKIISHSKPKKVLILTGTPSVFVGKKEFDIFYLPLFDLPPEKISDVTVELAISDCFKLGYKDHVKTGDVNKNKSDLISGKTELILEDVLKAIYRKIKSKARTSPKLYNSFLKKPCDWTGIINELQKTMFVCQSVEMANRTFNYFEKEGIKTLISCGDVDKESSHFDTFRKDPEYKILVIVDKGVLGYNMNDLATIVDLTMSTNLDRIHQLMCRLARISDVPKLYFKVTCPEMAQWMVHIMSGVLCLGHKDWMSKWNGKNFNNIAVPVLNKTNKKLKSLKGKGNKKTKSTQKQRYYLEIPSLKSMRDLTHSDSGLLSSHKYAKFGEVREEIFGIKFHDTEETKRKLLELARSGAPRPVSDKSMEGKKLVSYTVNSSSAFDEKFYNEIKKIRIDWFFGQTNIANEKKEKILEIAKSGKSKKMLGEYLESFRSYTSKNKSTFDSSFEEKIREIRPEWLKRSSDNNKEYFIQLAKSGGDLPENNSNLKKSFYYYLEDEDFLEKISKIRPDWLKTKREKKQQELIEMAKNMEEQPKSGSELYNCFHVSSDDFKKEIREIRPDWFKTISYSSEENKSNLIKLAKSGNKKPSKKDKLYQVFRSYINKKSPVYDKEFTNTLKSIRPDWFK